MNLRPAELEPCIEPDQEKRTALGDWSFPSSPQSLCSVSKNKRKWGPRRLDSTEANTEPHLETVAFSPLALFGWYVEGLSRFKQVQLVYSKIRLRTRFQVSIALYVLLRCDFKKPCLLRTNWGLASETGFGDIYWGNGFCFLRGKCHYLPLSWEVSGCLHLVG